MFSLWRRNFVGLHAVAAALLLAAGGGAGAQTPNPGQAPFVNWLTGLQTQSGYTVTPGAAAQFPGCSIFIGAFGSCFGNNASTPYILVQPPFDSANNVPGYAQAAGFETTGIPNPPGGNVTADDLWQIGQNEAIVTLITLPPQGAYFGYQSYMLERDAIAYTGNNPPPGNICMGGNHVGGGKFTQAPDCNYVVFGSFTNAVNNADIVNFTANPALPAWNSWNDSVTPHAPATYNTIAVITTPNATLAHTLTASFPGNQSYIFNEAMPATTLPNDPPRAQVLNTCTGPVRSVPGVSPSCDAFVTLVRYTLAESQVDGKAWLRGNNILVYRVTQPSSVVVTSTDLYEAGSVYNNVYTQGCNTDETAIAGAPCPTGSATLDADISGSIAPVLQAWAQDPSNAGEAYGIYQASGSTAVSTNGGVGSCIGSGQNCAGGTQDNDFYRNFKAGTLKNGSSATGNPAPVFVIGVLHSASTGDFTTPTPMNNADYTGISIADYSATFMNTGVADAANPNSASEYTAPRPNQFLLGSAYTVLTHLFLNGHSLYSQISPAAQADINNIYIHVFYRNDAPSSQCLSVFCTNPVDNDSTEIMGGSAPAPATGTALTTIPDADTVLLTERGYLLAPLAGATSGPTIARQFLTGAAAQYLESPYVVCDTIATGCGSQ